MPRLLAIPLRVLAPRWWAAWLAVSAAVITSALALFVYQATASLLDSQPLRALLATTSALSPAMWFEVNANISNLGWPLLFAAFWALLDRRAAASAVAARSLVVAGAALTSTLAALYTPLALAVSWRRRRVRRELLVCGVFLGSLAVQVVADRFAERGVSSPSSPHDLVELFLVRVVGSASVGERWLQSLWSHWHLWLAAALALAYVAVLVLGRRTRRQERRVMWLAAVASVVFFVVPVWIRGSDAMRLGDVENNVGSRYIVVPTLFVIAAVVLAAQGTGRHWPQRLVAVQLVLIVVSSFWLSNLRSAGPSWNSYLDAAVDACRSEGGDTRVQIKTTPSDSIWFVETTCQHIR